jgi:RNA polymerase sigma-70 factor (ECF subfamily)
MASHNEEFTSVFDAVYANLCRFLECLLGERGAAQDIAQESFLRLHRFGLYHLPPDEVRFWLFRVARNLALNEMQKRQTRSRLSAQAAGAFRDQAPDPEGAFLRAESNRMVRDLLRHLPERQRTALLLREQEEMSYREIARVLGVSEGNVKTDIFRARRLLRQRWDELHKAAARLCEGEVVS